VITIGQLARYVGVSTKTIRVYHAKGLLSEPDRDSAGYRRYTAQDAIDLIKIRTLAEAGVPLARIRELRAAPDDEFGAALAEIDEDLAQRIRSLRQTQRRLRGLTSGHGPPLPAEVDRFLTRLRALGLSERWIALERDLWILVFAAHPETAAELLRDQTRSLTDPDARLLYLDYDRVHDLDPQDPAVDDLARRLADATRRRYGSGDLPGQVAGSEIPGLIQGALNASSPAWQRLDTLIRGYLAG
jgi:DNA-binding transcriptional MerR regulator